MVPNYDGQGGQVEVLMHNISANDTDDSSSRFYLVNETDLVGKE